MSSAPSVIVFDVNETLSDMRPMAGRFAAIGAPEHLAKLWFATLLRDGFALTAAGSQRPVAVHPWDIDGAARAGMATAWLNRTGASYPEVFTPPSLTAASLAELAQQLG